MADPPNPYRVLVAGDITIDWNLARTTALASGGPGWKGEERTRAYQQLGGAVLLGELLRVIARQLSDEGRGQYEVWLAEEPRKAIDPSDNRFHHSYGLWTLFPYGLKPPLDREPPAWRLLEFLGLDRARSFGDEEGEDTKEARDRARPDLLVLDDADLGFRDRRRAWLEILRSSPDHRPWILVKIAHPVGQGALWECLQTEWAERLIAIMTIDDLRRSEVQVSRELSWERTAQDLAWELAYNPRVNALSRCALLIVSFGPAGALLLSNSPRPSSPISHLPSPELRLFFDPVEVEGSWEQDHPGGMIGYTSCLATGVARELMISADAPDIERGIQGSLAALRALHLEGYGSRHPGSLEAPLSFPHKLVAAALAHDQAGFAVAAVPEPARLPVSPGTESSGTGAWPVLEPGRDWSILQDRCEGDLNQVAERVAVHGADAALQGVPLCKFGALLTVDRWEIESLRAIRSLIGEYSRQRRPKQPLSIAVFGSPGSGKSFGVMEVARSLLPGQTKKLEFNISQLNDPQDLISALHQVRDAGLSGLLPLVFWDEFDCSLGGQPLGWLRHFLSPMQDGSFRSGQINHPIGPAIFVFAGGTSQRLEDFGGQLSAAGFQMAKGPDFLSRLKGYVNVRGPDPRTDQAHDPYYIIRRAILLRSILLRDARQLFITTDGREVLRIDPGVLRAFLQARVYKHGVRSMEALVSMSLLTGATHFERSCVPAEAQIELHVDARDFLALLQRLEPEGEMLEKLARAAHAVYREAAQKGTFIAPDSALKPYDGLGEDEKEQNRSAVRDIVNKLEMIGYFMVPARSGTAPVDFPGAELELLAEQEHLRWTKAKLREGWRYASETDKEKKLHSALLPWPAPAEAGTPPEYSAAELKAMGTAELPEAEKEKDREMIRAIPHILTRAGYRIVRR